MGGGAISNNECLLSTNLTYNTPDYYGLFSDITQCNAN